ncbi:MAG: TonB-dependent receptor [Agarilytica sp.]
MIPLNKIIPFFLVLVWSVATAYAGVSIKSNYGAAQYVFYLDISEMPLGEALLAISTKSGVNIVVPSRVVVGYKAKPIVGRHTLESALSGVMSGLPFDYSVMDGGQGVSIYKSATPSDQPIVKKRDRKETRMLEEVLVLARHREELAFDVPISLDSFSDSAAFLHNITTLEGIGFQSSNTILRVPRGTNSSVSAFIRGLGQDDPLAGFESGVGVYIDGVYLNRPQAPIMDIYNLERVEILKGPQGTLYGRNTIGGAVKYTTKPIRNEPESSLDVSLGSYNQKDIILNGSTPIAGTIAKVGGSVASFQRGGFGKNLNTGQDNADKSIEAARLNMEIQPTDQFSLRLSSDITVDDSNTKSGYRLLSSPAMPLVEGRYDTQAGLQDDYHPINQNKVISRGYSSTLEWKMDEHFLLNMVTAFRSDDVDSAIDFNALPNNNLDVHVRYENEQFSQELRLSYSSENLHALFGYYFLDTKALSAFDTEIEGISNFNGIQFSLSDIDTTSNSIFFNSTYDFSTRFSSSIGLRYTVDKNVAQIEKGFYTLGSQGTYISPYFGGDGFLLTPVVRDGNGNEVVPNFRGRRKDNSLLPRVSVSWQPAKDRHFYLSYSEGYKSGSFDPRADYSEEEARRGYSPETLDTYEFGVKWRGYENRLHTDIAIFSGHYQNIQIPGERSGPNNTNQQGFYVKNSAEADIDGIELSVKYDLGANWQVGFEGGLLDAQYSKYMTYDGQNISNQRKLINAPEKSISINLDRKFDLNRYGLITAYYNYIYRSGVSVVGEYPTPLYQDVFDISNIGFVWQSSDNKYSIGFHAKNIFDEKYLVDGYYYPELGIITAFYGDPRTFTFHARVALY